MKTKYLINFFIFFQVSICAQDCCVIQGNVFDEVNGNKLVGVNVIVEDLNIGASTDINGSFILKNIPEGKHIISYRYIPYLIHKDTITLNSENKSINVKVLLKEYKSVIESKPEIEEYHLRLQKYSKNNKLLKIHIDKLEYSNGKVFVSSTFTNASVEPIYIIKECPCFRVIKPIVYKEDKFVKSNCISLECDVLPYTLINESDLIKIEPDKSISYPPTELYLYTFNNLPDGKYKVGIKYNFGGPSSLGGIFSTPKDDAILTALRGEYFSDNFLIFTK